MSKDAIGRPKATIDKTINISWDNALASLEEITLKLGIGNHGDLFSVFDVNRLKELIKFVEKEIAGYEEAIKQNQEG